MKNYNFKIVFTFFVFFFAKAALASSGEHNQHDEGIPTQTIIYQAINLGLLLIGLFFATKKSIVLLFESRQKNYKEQAEKTEAAMKEAEKELSDIKSKLSNLEQSEQKSIELAQQEATKQKSKLIEESTQQAKKIKEDVSLIISAELAKAKTEIRSEIVSASMIQAEKNIKKSADVITKKSEKGFLEDLSKIKGQVHI